MSSSEDESGISWENIETIKSFDGSEFKFQLNFFLKNSRNFYKNIKFQLNQKLVGMEIQQNYKKVQ